ncbi:DUF2705 family protein [Anoxybacillus flavithermus]|nr:DUF2705 family protein [Anoxybacillus flavithermus]MBE2941210.1 DUF2705 family protein [Anoxybacillus flavithermus]MBE2952504.1 DUF2705 family protein [Anoxybacillus flavithermus]MBE2955206.1 DUF2705 family protein [Anoxybacillus flavithermus]MBE2960552.1 DUF2705 family protein [Anoxybacillus flavithermus]
MTRHFSFFLFVVGSFIVQAIFANRFQLFSFYGLFVDGVPFTSSHSLVYKYLLIWYFPVASITFYFSGHLEYVRKHAIVLFVRSYNRVKWMLKQHIYAFVVMVVFIFIQTFIMFLFRACSDNVWTLNGIKGLYMYLSMIYTLVCVQWFLELYVEARLSHLIVNLYVLLSILLSNELHDGLNWLHYFFIPDYGMGFRNGLSSSTAFEHDVIHFSIGCLILLFSQFLFIYFSVRKAKRMDWL